MFVDAAKAANVDLLIWSGIQSMAKVTGGKYKNVVHFDGERFFNHRHRFVIFGPPRMFFAYPHFETRIVKEEVIEYGKASGLTFVSVEPAVFMDNFTATEIPKKQADGSYIMYGVAAPEGVNALIDVKHDYGLFVRKAIEAPGDAEIYAYSELISWADMAKQFSEGMSLVDA